MEKIDKIYEKIHPGYFAFITAIIWMIGLIPAMLVQTDFSFFATHLSFLGSPLNDLYIFFNIFWFISAIFQIIFFLGFTRYLQEKGSGVIITWITFILSVLSSIGVMGFTIFNSVEAFGVHIIFFMIAFFGGTLYLFSYAYVEWRSSGFSIVQALFNIIVAIFFIIYFILTIVNYGPPVIFPEAHALTGWLFVLAYLIWFFENGIYILLKK
ncbi:MAG: hypothetical protein ACXACX_02500 [Candidatus Hodarchaeales archaeon]|jgi:hypothetical protein